MNNNTHSPYARKRAVGALLIFTVFGIYGAWRIDDWGTGSLAVFLYAILLVNTYLSIRSFASIDSNPKQQAIDSVLAAVYAGASLNFQNYYFYWIFIGLVFALGSLKHVLMIQELRYVGVLKRKIILNMLGAIGSLAALGFVYAGYGTLAMTLGVVVFTITSIYIIFLRPAYELTDVA